MDDDSLQVKIEDAQEHTRKAEQLVSAAEDQLEEIVTEEKNVDGTVSAFYSSADDAFHVTITDEDLLDKVSSHTDDDTAVSGGSMSLTISPGDSLVPNTTGRIDEAKSLRELISRLAEGNDEGAPVEEVLTHADAIGFTPSKAEKEIENLRRKGELYEPIQGHLRTT